jgi:hypothetical protein
MVKMVVLEAVLLELALLAQEIHQAQPHHKEIMAVQEPLVPLLMVVVVAGDLI